LAADLPGIAIFLEKCGPFTDSALFSAFLLPWASAESLSPGAQKVVNCCDRSAAAPVLGRHVAEWGEFGDDVPRSPWKSPAESRPTSFRAGLLPYLAYSGKKSHHGFGNMFGLRWAAPAASAKHPTNSWRFPPRSLMGPELFWLYRPGGIEFLPPPVSLALLAPRVVKSHKPLQDLA
jgi:hypothetical protein